MMVRSFDLLISLYEMMMMMMVACRWILPRRPATPASCQHVVGQLQTRKAERKKSKDLELLVRRDTYLFIPQ